jgi:predicted Zn-ribbon and HTH transcriptional regulator
MKNDSEIPMIKEEDLVSANMRRDNYSLKRDVQAREFNQAIETRLLAESVKSIKCEKCGKEFTISESVKDILKCPDCR